MSASSDTATSTTLLREVRDPGNVAAWRTFLARYEPLLRRWSGKWGLQAADQEDVCQRVLLKLAQALPEFAYDPRHKFRSYLARAVQNAVYDFLGERARTPGHRGSGDSASQQALEAVPDVAEIVETLTVELQPVQRLRRAMLLVQARVAEQTWSAFRLTECEGCTPQEAADRLGIKLSAIYVSRHRVVKMLKEEMERLPAGE